MAKNNKKKITVASVLGNIFFPLNLFNGSKGILVKFNPKNIYGDEPCCCQKKYYTKFSASTMYCFLCNLFCLRKKKKVNSFCKENGWAETCTTCQQKGTYNNPRDGVIKE